MTDTLVLIKACKPKKCSTKIPKDTLDRKCSPLREEGENQTETMFPPPHFPCVFYWEFVYLMYSLKNKQTSRASTGYLGIALNAGLWSVLDFHKAHRVPVWIPRTLAAAWQGADRTPVLLSWRRRGFLLGNNFLPTAPPSNSQIVMHVKSFVLPLDGWAFMSRL